MADPHWGPVEQWPQGGRARRQTPGRGRRWARGILIIMGALAVLGLISATPDAEEEADDFIAALAKHRHFVRETDPPSV